MAAAKFKVSDVAKAMKKTEKEVIFNLQSLGVEVTDANQVIEPDVIQALIHGKKLVTRTRSVLMRWDRLRCSRCVCGRTPSSVHRRDLVGSRSRFLAANGRRRATLITVGSSLAHSHLASE